MQRSNPAITKFYNSPEWKRCREAYRKGKMNICERCGGLGYFVHHKEYINMSNIYNPDITLNFDNLELLCKDCHNKEHFAESNFDLEGNLINHNENIMELCGIKKKANPPS